MRSKEMALQLELDAGYDDDQRAVLEALADEMDAKYPRVLQTPYSGREVANTGILRVYRKRRRILRQKAVGRTILRSHYSFIYTGSAMR